MPLLWSCILTWLFGGTILAVLALASLGLLLAPDQLFEAMHEQDPSLSEQGLSDTEIRTATLVAAAVLVPWCLAACVVAFFAYRGASWARVALLISAGAAGLLCLLGSLANPFLIVPMAACTTTVALLMRQEVRAWFAR